MDYIVGLIKTEFDVVSSYDFNLLLLVLIGCIAFLKSHVQI